MRELFQTYNKIIITDIVVGGFIKNIKTRKLFVRLGKHFANQLAVYQNKDCFILFLIYIWNGFLWKQVSPSAVRAVRECSKSKYTYSHHVFNSQLTVLVNSVMPFFIFLSGYTGLFFLVIICIHFFEDVSNILTLNVITDHYEVK